MALIKCPNCGGTVSDQAPQCPHCKAQLVDDNDIILQPDNPEEEPIHIDIPSMYAPPRPDPIIDDSVFNTTFDDPDFVIATTPQPTAKSARGRAVLYIVLALLFAAACGVGVYIYMDNKQKSAKNELPASGDAADVVQTIDDFDDGYDGYDSGEWDDDIGGDVFDPIPEGSEHLYGHVYAVSTDAWEDECKGWIKPYLPAGTARAAVFADRIWLRSSMSTGSDSNKLALLEYGTMLDVVSQPSDQWVEVRADSGESRGRSGYVSAEFIIDAANFEIMDRLLTSDAQSRSNLSTAKWRRALTDALITGNWQYCPGQLTVTRPYTIDVSPRQMMAFRIFDPSDGISCIAYIEFYEGDEEYRLLGCTYDCEILKGECTSTGSYRLTLDFSRLYE